MSFKTIKPFIMEFIILIFVVIGGAVLLLVGNIIKIHINKSVILVIASIIIFFVIISLFSRIVNITIRALIDYISQKTKSDDYIFIKEESYQASMFTEKYDRNHNSVIATYYLIHTKKNNKVYTFLSSSYLEMKEGKMYTIKSGKYSNILTNYELVSK